jgi:hypothetical protein
VKLVPVPELRATNVPGAIEGENMKVLKSTGQLEKQHLTEAWSGERQLWWKGAKPGDQLELGFEVKEAGRKRVMAHFGKAVDYAIAQLYVNGQKAGTPIDFYNDRVVAAPEIDLGEFALQMGQNTLTIEITGANPKARKSYMVGLDYILLK